MKFLSLLVLAAAVLVATGAVAQDKPADNVSNQRDPKFRFTHVGPPFESFALATGLVYSQSVTGSQVSSGS